MSLENDEVTNGLKEMSLNQQKVVIPFSTIDYQIRGSSRCRALPFFCVSPLVPYTSISAELLERFYPILARKPFEPYDGPEWVGEDGIPINILGQLTCDLEILEGPFNIKHVATASKVIVIHEEPSQDVEPYQSTFPNRRTFVAGHIYGKDVIDKLGLTFDGKKILFPRRFEPEICECPYKLGLEVKSELREMSLDQQKIVVDFSKIDWSAYVTGFLSIRGGFTAMVNPLVPYTTIPYDLLKDHRPFLAEKQLEPYDGPEWVGADGIPLEIMGKLTCYLAIEDSAKKKAAAPSKVIIVHGPIVTEIYPTDQHMRPAFYVFPILGKDVIDRFGITIDGEKVLLPEMFECEPSEPEIQRAPGDLQNAVGTKCDYCGFERKMASEVNSETN